MPSPALQAAPAAARRFLRRALLLDRPAPDVSVALAHLGYVQIDPINICGRMHDLILRNRVAGYREGDLHRYLHPAPPASAAGGAGRKAFEHYLPGAGVLVAFPLEAWPHLIDRAYRRRNNPRGYAGKLSPAEERLARRILGELAERGPLTSDEIEHDGHAYTGWGARARMVKTVLEKLFVHARVLIAGRRNFRRVYDLPERVLPPAAWSTRPPPPEATDRWLVELRLRQRRLAPLKKAEMALAEDLVRPVEIPGCPRLFCLREDAGRLEEAGSDPPPGERGASRPLLLAPLDPLIYERRIARTLWNFDYAWEAYLPAAKRRRGYYALPVLAGAEMVGHVDPKADRERGKLVVVSRRVRRGQRIGPAIRELAAFLGLK